MNSTEYIEKNFALEKAENQNYLGVLYHVESDTIIKFIKSLPTVDAVPVEFIKGEIKNNKGFYNSSLRRLLDAWAERK
jgi:hypothetical protein